MTELLDRQKILGFTVEKVTPLPQFRGTGIELKHDKTGARLFHLYTPQDGENLFSVFFPTPPTDDTGVPHILEHAVLGGSKRFPVKDPFFEMVKSSMATFINAMTANDFTVYPVSSNVRQDFYNLTEVYWDAVFYPELTRTTFEREGHRLEFATPGDPTSPLIIKGIVYNEMKGGRSGPDAVAWDLIGKALWPDTVYGRDSGGDPEVIPTLTYENFVAFHRQWYHPSNARLFLYGDIPTQEHLEFLAAKLDAFSPRVITPELGAQPRWKQPREMKAAYSVGEDETTAGKTLLTMSWMTVDAGNFKEALTLQVAATILLGNQGAPLRKALIDSKLGTDITHAGFQVWARETSFHIGIKGSEPERQAAFIALVLKTLKDVAQEIPRAHVEAAFQQLAYSSLEISSGFPVNLLWRVTESWLYAESPLPGLYMADLLEEVKRDYAANPRLFGEAIEKHLLRNTHRFDLVLTPEPGLQARKDAALVEKLAEQKKRLDEKAAAQIAARQAELERSMNTANTPEALATLPQLQVADLPRKPRHIPTSVQKLPTFTFLHNDVFANGINYLHLHVNLQQLPSELWAYLPIYADCVGKMGAAGQDYVAIAERKAALTGGVGFGFDATRTLDAPARAQRGATLSTRFLDATAEPVLRLLHDLLFAVDVATPERLREILIQARAHHRTRPAQSGLSIALVHAARHFSPQALLNYETAGVPATRRIEALAAAKDLDDLIARLTAIREHLKRGALTASFTGSASVQEHVLRTLGQWPLVAREQKAAAVDQQVAVAAPCVGIEGLAAPMDASYCALVLPAPLMTAPESPRLQVANRLLSMNYVLEEVRFKGTAYGGGSTYNALGGTLAFHSYRDPWITRTLDVYRGARDWLAKTPWSKGDVDRAIIGTAKDGERPIRPGEATGAALTRHLLGDTRERRDARHAALLSATPENTQRPLLEWLDAHQQEGCISVVSSRERLEAAAKERPETPLAIEDILPAS